MSFAQSHKQSVGEDFKPDFSGLSDQEKEIAERAIQGSNLLYWQVVARATLNPTDIAYAKSLNEKIEEQKWDRLSTPINFQKEQKPKFQTMGCVDSRVLAPTILCLALGEFLHHDVVACGIEDAGHISAEVAGMISMGIEDMKVSTIVLMPHGRCGGVNKAWHLSHEECPSDPTKVAKWNMLQPKFDMFAELQSKGADYFLTKAGVTIPYESEEDRFLHAAEICGALRDLRIAKAYVSEHFKNDKVEVVSLFVDLRTLDVALPRLVGEGDWEWRRLTNHPATSDPHKYAEQIGLT